MPSSSLKQELADHIYQYLCHEIQYSDMPEAAKESLTAASECIEQAYKLNVVDNHHQSSNSSTSKHNDMPQQQLNPSKPSADILPDELLRIFMRHKEFLAQQKKSLVYPLRNADRDETPSALNEKPDIRVNSNAAQAASSSNDSQNNTNNGNTHNYNTNNMSPTLNSSNNNTTSSITSNQQQHQQASSSNNNAINQNQQTAAAASTTAPATTATKQHNQHPISQLPMTTRKKLSHLRAQIKRQASKAARSRLEKRSSVSGVGGDKGGSSHFGISFDGSSSSKHHQAGDAHHKELHNQPNSSSSTESPNAYSNNQPTSSPATGGNTTDPNANANLSPTQHHDGGTGPSGTKHLVGQHSLAAPGQHGSGHHHHHSIHQKNFKQKIIALLKKFRTDGSDFDSEEQYRAALERELLAVGRDSTAIDELLEEEIDVEEESGSEIEDWDNISETSTPKPSLRPFFSSTTLDKI